MRDGASNAYGHCWADKGIYGDEKGEEETRSKARMRGMQSCRGRRLSGASSLYLNPFNSSCCSQGWVWSPKRGERVSERQVGEATLPWPPLQPFGVGRRRKNVHLGPHEAGKRDSPCPPWQSASPAGRGPVTSAPQPGAAQSLLCSLLKTRSLRGCEWLYYKSSRPCGIPVVPKLPMTGTTYT